MNEAWSHLEKEKTGDLSHVAFEWHWLNSAQILFTEEGTVWMMVGLSVLGDISAGSQRWVVYKHTQPVGMCICLPAWVIRTCGGQGPSRWGAQRPEAYPTSDLVLKWAVLFSQRQLACCHLVTFKRQLWQSEQSVFAYDMLTHALTRTPTQSWIIGNKSVQAFLNSVVLYIQNRIVYGLSSLQSSLCRKYNFYNIICEHLIVLLYLVP